MFKQILLAYDGSESARRAAEYAEQLACKFKGQVDVVYAYGPIQHGMDDSLRQARTEEEINAGDALIGNLLATLDCAGVTAFGHVVDGRPEEVILQQARLCADDIIVMGSRGLLNPEGYLVGSVSDRVVNEAACPVLVVK